jgi:hypothetical protein
MLSRQRFCGILGGIGAGAAEKIARSGKNDILFRANWNFKLWIGGGRER